MQKNGRNSLFAASSHEIEKRSIINIRGLPV